MYDEEERTFDNCRRNEKRSCIPQDERDYRDECFLPISTVAQEQRS